MTRKAWPALALAVWMIAGCAGPEKLARVSQDRLAKGDMWRAWTLATKALDKAPANANARHAAAVAGATIAQDWERRIHGLAESDTVAAGEQVLEFAEFRTNAVRYATIATSPGWHADEYAIRHAAARIHYSQGVADLGSQRPKRAYLHFTEAQRFVANYGDAARLADKALARSITRVAFVPLRTAIGRSSTGANVAASWRGEVVEHLNAETHFTQILPSEDIERAISLSDMAGLNRDDAVRLGKRAKADRVVWGSIGAPEAKNGVQIFADVVWHKVSYTDHEGNRSTHWVEVPLEVIARTRTVKVNVDYEVISTRGGVTLARKNDPRTIQARVVWTSYVPQGSCGDYSLVSETTDSEQAKRVQAKWSAVVGEGTTLSQVLEAKRSSANASTDRRQILARFAAGAAFVMLQDLPSTEELAMAALQGGWQPVYQDLLHLDPLDDVDLGLTAAETDQR
jgi:hypothetical protein